MSTVKTLWWTMTSFLLRLLLWFWIWGMCLIRVAVRQQLHISTPLWGNSKQSTTPVPDRCYCGLWQQFYEKIINSFPLKMPDTCSAKPRPLLSKVPQMCHQHSWWYLKCCVEKPPSIYCRILRLALVRWPSRAWNPSNSARGLSSWNCSSIS